MRRSACEVSQGLDQERSLGRGEVRPALHLRPGQLPRHLRRQPFAVDGQLRRRRARGGRPAGTEGEVHFMYSY